MKELFPALILVPLMLLGCKSTSGPVGEPTTPVEQTSGASVANELPVVEGEFEMKGHFHHAPSGTHFAPAIGVFERTSAHRYSKEEENFSFRYEPAGQSGGLKIDVYVYPRDDDTDYIDTDQWLAYLGDRMAEVVGGMKHHYTDVVVVDAVGYDAPTATGKMLWITLEATYVDEGVPTTSWAYIAAHEGWFYKMRMSTDSTRAEAGRKLQKLFFDGFTEQIEVRGAQPDTAVDAADRSDSPHSFSVATRDETRRHRW